MNWLSDCIAIFSCMLAHQIPVDWKYWKLLQSLPLDRSTSRSVLSVVGAIRFRVSCQNRLPIFRHRNWGWDILKAVSCFLEIRKVSRMLPRLALQSGVGVHHISQQNITQTVTGSRFFAQLEGWIVLESEMCKQVIELFFFFFEGGRSSVSNRTDLIYTTSPQSILGHPVLSMWVGRGKQGIIVVSSRVSNVHLPYVYEETRFKNRLDCSPCTVWLPLQSRHVNVPVWSDLVEQFLLIVSHKVKCSLQHFPRESMSQGNTVISAALWLLTTKSKCINVHILAWNYFRWVDHELWNHKVVSFCFSGTVVTSNQSDSTIRTTAMETEDGNIHRQFSIGLWVITMLSLHAYATECLVRPDHVFKRWERKS